MIVKPLYAARRANPCSPCGKPYTPCRKQGNPFAKRAFSLVELLTVMFIIGALIAILVPSLNSARNTAKKTATKTTLSSIAIGLDMFRDSHERDFRQTNGYPPSYAHPPIPGYTFDPIEGEFPFLTQDPPKVYGAQWLPAMLMGVDQGGYVKRSSVPKKDNLRTQPWRWYLPDPLTTGRPLERMDFYVDPGAVKTVRTKDLDGKPNLAFFPGWAANDGVSSLPVMVDSFDQPILYYVASTNGQANNMVAEERNKENVYTGGLQKEGPPYYFHEDNVGFTGDLDKPGWDFGTGAHPLANPGEELNAETISDPANPLAKKTFAWFVLDKKQEREFRNMRQEDKAIESKTPLRPSNPKQYLLISAGVDGLYGTQDDVTNFPLSADQ